MAPSLPPPVALYQMSVGHYGSRALYLAAKLGVADQLAGGPRDARALAEATQTDPAALARVLRFLVSAGVFDEDEGGRFALTPIGELLRAGVPGSMRATVLLFTGVGIQDSWKEIEWCVRTGQPAFRRADPDADPFTQIAADPENARIFDEAMAAFAPQTAAVVAAAYDFSPFATVVDVGGGNGALLLGILQRYPKLRGTVFDRADVVERARAHLAANGMAERCAVAGGSFFERVPEGADAYLLKHVIHDWNDEQAAAILRVVRAAIPAHGRLLIVEGLYPARIDRSLESRGATANDVNMLICTGGRQRSEAEFRQLFAAAGFRLARVVPTVAQLSVIEGECA